MSKSKIAIILPCNVYTAPFLDRYEEIIKSKGENFDLIYWNRAQIDENSTGDQIPFNLKDEVNSGKWTKLIKYIRYGIFVKNSIKRNNYEKIIILGSYAGIMYQLRNILSKKYKNRYWLDIRDFTFENFKFYYSGMEKVISNAYSTTISSRGFEKFLPEHDYIVAHNIDYKNIENSKALRLGRINNGKIRISFIGLVRYYDENLKLLKALGNDERYIINYFGMNSDCLRKYCVKNDITNVNFHGRFNPSKTGYFYSHTDIINNIYGNKNIALTTALSNKLYYSVFLNIPILVSPNTYMQEITTKNGIGYTIDWNNVKLGEDLYNWYRMFTTNISDENQNLKETIIKEDKKFEIEFIKFLDK